MTLTALPYSTRYAACLDGIPVRSRTGNVLTYTTEKAALRAARIETRKINNRKLGGRNG